MVYCKLLSHYRTNPAESNRHVVRMLHRLSWDLKMSPLLYQASVFKSFQAILRDYRSLAATSISEDLRELARLATFVVRDFVETARDNKLAFVELLFWKNTKDAYEIKHGYGSSAKSAHSGKVTWTEEQEYELKALYDRYKDEVTPGKNCRPFLSK
ncbi:timeless, putative [Ixodes scapularis]|uniref:Timeless, putative n=1 Tax=Ixodes scapularis TaxID=6945 RepID=B7QB56_IXOSC|nr:timeless, putative [Ixodes scapularis]|eukprot:XP_002412782.1 timeless, putative [Ixodes scapularis]